MANYWVFHGHADIYDCEANAENIYAISQRTITKHNTQGVLIWEKYLDPLPLDTSSTLQFTNMVVDAAGFIYCIATRLNSNESSIYIIKLDSDGVQLYCKRIFISATWIHTGSYLKLLYIDNTLVLALCRNSVSGTDPFIIQIDPSSGNVTSSRYLGITNATLTCIQKKGQNILICVSIEDTPPALDSTYILEYNLAYTKISETKLSQSTYSLSIDNILSVNNQLYLQGSAVSYSTTPGGRVYSISSAFYTAIDNPSTIRWTKVILGETNYFEAPPEFPFLSGSDSGTRIAGNYMYQAENSSDVYITSRQYVFGGFMSISERITRVSRLNSAGSVIHNKEFYHALNDDQCTSINKLVTNKFVYNLGYCVFVSGNIEANTGNFSTVDMIPTDWQNGRIQIQDATAPTLVQTTLTTASTSNIQLSVGAYSSDNVTPLVTTFLWYRSRK